MLRLILIFLCSVSQIVCADIQIQKPHPDETPEELYEYRLSTENALNELNKIEAALDEYRFITEKIKNKK